MQFSQPCHRDSILMDLRKICNLRADVLVYSVFRRMSARVRPIILSYFCGSSCINDSIVLSHYCQSIACFWQLRVRSICPTLLLLNFCQNLGNKHNTFGPNQTIFKRVPLLRNPCRNMMHRLQPSIRTEEWLVRLFKKSACARFDPFSRANNCSWEEDVPQEWWWWVWRWLKPCVTNR